MADAGADAGADAPEVIPEEWGWPKEPFDPAVLRVHVNNTTKATAQEQWDKALEARTVGGTHDDHIAEKAFANLVLNKEGTGEEKEGAHHSGIDPNAYKAGKWYRFLNFKGDCYVYVHNYTKNITATKPANFAELSEEEKRKLRKMGVHFRELPDELNKIYDTLKRIPIVFASQDTCEALKVFSTYDSGWQLLDCTKLKRVSAKALEDSRRAIVSAMKLGKMLCVCLGDDIPELQEKICTTKNRDTFPFAVWQYGSLETDMTKNNIYREEDKEANQCVVRPGFRVCVVLNYDTMMFQMSSMRKDEMKNKIPNFDHMEQVRTYSDDEVQRLLETL